MFAVESDAVNDIAEEADQKHHLHCTTSRLEATRYRYQKIAKQKSQACIGRRIKHSARQIELEEKHGTH